MKFVISVFSRLTALVILLIFTFVSCYNPAIVVPLRQVVVITPGEGTPTYIFLDKNNDIVAEDQGRTALFIEDNPNARGVIVIADRYRAYDRVMIYNSNNDSLAAMYFREGARFPHFMSVRYGGEELIAYFSYFRQDYSSFNVFFSDNQTFWPLTNLFMNPAIFDLYQTAPGFLDRNESQNLRIRNIIVALGLSGSLSHQAFQNEPSRDDFVWAEPAILGTIARGVGAFFGGVAIVATAVAVIVAPLVSFISPAAGMAIGTIAGGIALASEGLAGLFLMLANWLEGSPPSPPPEAVAIPAVSVSIVNENGNEDLVNGAEFHVSVGQEVLLEFFSPGMNHADFTLDRLMLNRFGLGWEPGNPYFHDLPNSYFFNITLKTDGLPRDVFRISIRYTIPTDIGDGRVAFGFFFQAENLQINGYVQPVEYMLHGEREPSMRTDAVVVWFCIYRGCQEVRGSS